MLWQCFFAVSVPVKLVDGTRAALPCTIRPWRMHSTVECTCHVSSALVCISLPHTKAGWEVVRRACRASRAVCVVPSCLAHCITSVPSTPLAQRSNTLVCATLNYTTPNIYTQLPTHLAPLGPGQGRPCMPAESFFLGTPQHPMPRPL